ncbi:hypothetical protein ACFLYM_01850 [Chloroflexota bacterium]
MDIDSVKNIGEIVLFAATCLLSALLVAGFCTGIYCLIASLIDNKRTRKHSNRGNFHGRTV